MIPLQNKAIVITGASSGIGRATALACARVGMHVIVAARRQDRLDALAQEIQSLGGRATPIACDVSRAADGEHLAQAATAAAGPIYAVFANAGYALEGGVMESTDEDIRQVFETNFFGSLNIIRPLLPGMIERRSGHLIFCSSCLSKIGTPSFASYSASKAAQDHYARAMRLELADSGLHVSSIHPIGTRTEFFDKVGERSPNAKLALRTPASMMQTPERVANAILRCLHRPRGEVWTSLPMRTALGLAVIFPAIADRILSRFLTRRNATPPGRIK